MLVLQALVGSFLPFLLDDKVEALETPKEDPMSGPPRLPLHVGDYIKDTPSFARANWEHHGIYLIALMIAWSTPGSRLPNDPKWLAERFGCTAAEYKARVAPVIARYFHSNGNWLYQKRLSREAKFVRNNSQLQSDRAKSRWRKDKKNAAASDHDERQGDLALDENSQNATDPRKPRKSHDKKNAAAYAVAMPPHPHPHLGSIPIPSSNSLHSPEPPPPERALLAPKALDRAMEDEALRRWNETAKAHNLASVTKLSDQRRRKLALRLQELDGIDGWQSMLGKIAASSFMRGSGDKGWVVDFEFLLSPTNVTKIMEGRYDDRRQRPKAGSATDTFAKLREQLGKGRASNGDGQQHPAKVSKFRPRIA